MFGTHDIVSRMSPYQHDLTVDVTSFTTSIKFTLYNLVDFHKSAYISILISFIFMVSSTIILNMELKFKKSAYCMKKI